MRVLITEEFDVSVSSFPANPQKTLFAPLVRVISRNDQKTIATMTTTQRFPNVSDAERYGIVMGQQWISNLR